MEEKKRRVNDISSIDNSEETEDVILSEYEECFDNDEHDIKNFEANDI